MGTVALKRGWNLCCKGYVWKEHKEIIMRL